MYIALVLQGSPRLDARTPHDTRSISKSVVSLLVGVALERGALASLSVPALSFFPEHAALQQQQAAQHITPEHLLTMSSGLAWDEGGLPNDETRLFWTAEPLLFVLDRPFDAAPGQRFHYNSGGTALLAEVLTRTQRTNLTTLARQQLFEPLGIRDWEWAPDLRNRELAFTGLRMRPRDLAKLGRLVLARGQRQGRQIVSAAWIDASTSPHITTSLRLPPGASEPLGYGYQWWTGNSDWSNDRRVGWSAAFGNGGQRLYVVPALDLTVVITAGDYGSQPINAVVQLLFERIVASTRPAVDAPSPSVKP